MAPLAILSILRSISADPHLPDAAVIAFDCSFAVACMACYLEHSAVVWCCFMCCTADTVCCFCVSSCLVHDAIPAYLTFLTKHGLHTARMPHCR